MTTWLDALEPGAPDIVAIWRSIDEEALMPLRREVRRRAGPGTAHGITVQLATLADALTTIVDTLDGDDLRRPGGEEDWNVAQTLGHTADARAGLSLAASRAAAGTFPPDAPVVVPGVPGPADAERDALRRRIVQSQRIIERSARAVAGHERQPCPLVHPIIGRLRCGEWLVFAGVHDLMHLEQLHRLVGTLHT